jgi:hypothetical protein
MTFMRKRSQKEQEGTEAMELLVFCTGRLNRHMPNSLQRTLRQKMSKREGNLRKINIQQASQVLRFLKSYESILLKNSFEGHTLLFPVDLLHKSMEKRKNPFCMLITKDTPLGSDQLHSLCYINSIGNDSSLEILNYGLIPSEEHVNNEQWNAFLSSLSSSYVTISRTSNNDMAAMEHQRVKKLCEIFRKNLGDKYFEDSDKDHVYYLLRSGLLFNLTPIELMDHWFRVQKYALFTEWNKKFQIRTSNSNIHNTLPQEMKI